MGRQVPPRRSSHRHPLGGLFVLLCGYFVFITAIFVGDPRYHYPLVPFAAILAAKGLMDDFPALATAMRERLPEARSSLWVWGVIVAGFCGLMAANVALKMLEFSALGEH